MTRATLDSKNEDLKLRPRPVETNLDRVLLSDLAETESDRIQRTAKSAAGSIQQLPLVQFHAKLNETKLSEIPAISAKVVEVAQSVNLVQTPDNTQEILDDIAAQQSTLSDDSVPLSDQVDAQLSDLLGPDATTADKKGYLIQINELVAEIMKLISKMNDRDRQKTDHMKKDYGKLNNKVGSAIQDRGTTTFWSNVGALFARIGSTVLGAAIGSDAFQKAGDALGQQIPGLTGILSTGYEVKQTKSSNELNLLSTDMQSTSQKSGDNSGWKNEITQLLQEVRQLLTAAARAN